MYRPNSARHRVPEGKTNYSDSGAIRDRPKSASCTPPPKVPAANSRPGTAGADTGLIGDPYRNFDSTPRAFAPPPILPKSRFPTVPPPEEVPKSRYKRPPICPDSWLKKNDEVSFLLKLDFKMIHDKKGKRQMARKFIEDNRDRLGKFDMEYYGKSPQDVCDSMIDHPNFANLMIGYHMKERSLNLGSSHEVAGALRDDGFNSLGEVKTDPYLASFSTSRQQKEERLRQLLAAPDAYASNRYKRGYRHAPEYGNFSQFNGLLISNKGTCLPR